MPIIGIRTSTFWNGVLWKTERNRLLSLVLLAFLAVNRYRFPFVYGDIFKTYVNVNLWPKCQLYVWMVS